MILQKFIEEKHEELKRSNLYKEVIFSGACDIELARNGSSENFITVYSDLEKLVEEVDKSQSNLGSNYQSGTNVEFDVLEKRKRKYTTKNFYAIYK